MQKGKMCLQCGESFRGRSDKKFCSVDCKSTYNNERYRDSNNYMRQVNRILKRNRRILKEIEASGISKLHKSELNEHGYNFSYSTNVKRFTDNRLQFLCYEIGLQELNENLYVIISKDRLQAPRVDVSDSKIIQLGKVGR